MLMEEIPEVLELASRPCRAKTKRLMEVCDTYLEQYDKQSSGRSKQVIAMYQLLIYLKAHYIMRRF